MRWGVCCANNAMGELSTLTHALQTAGYDYMEFGAYEVREEDAFEALRAGLEGQPLRPEAWNSFVPATHRITGPDGDLGSLLQYCETTLTRCRALGGEVMVLGSGGARRVPEGFDPAKAREQFVEFCRELGPVAQQAGMTICLEPLNRREDNLLNSVADGALIVDEVAHPHIQLLADLYHITEDAEPLEGTAGAGRRLRHTHGADLGRAAPGFATEGEADFVGFFRALHRAGYNDRFSFEGVFSDMGAQLKPMLQLLQRRWREAE